MATQRTDGGDEPADGLHIPQDVAADLLDDERTRAMLAALAENDELPARRLVREVLAREEGTDPGTFDPETVREAHHVMFEESLPRLTATELVAYDSMLGQVSLSPAGRRLIERHG